MILFEFLLHHHNYNVPNVEALKYHYENLPEKLKKEGVDPRVPWLYNFKLDFRVR